MGVTLDRNERTLPMLTNVDQNLIFITSNFQGQHYHIKNGTKRVVFS